MSNACLCRPTKMMLLMYLLWTLMVMQAYMHNLNAEYLALFMVMGMTFVLLFMTKANVRGVRLAHLSTKRAFADMPISMHVSIESKKNRFNLYALAPFDSKRFSLSASSALKTVTLQGKKRGVYNINTLALQTRYPIGLFKCTCTYPIDATIHVAPKPYGKALEQVLHNALSISGDRDEFIGHKAYEHTDPTRSIDWKASAKSEAFLSKKFSHLRQDAALVFHYDEAGKGKEEKLSQLCFWVLECEKRALPFSIAMPEQTLHSNRMGIDEILLLFARY